MPNNGMKAIVEASKSRAGVSCLIFRARKKDTAIGEPVGSPTNKKMAAMPPTVEKSSGNNSSNEGSIK